jgi:biotin carboxylase
MKRILLTGAGGPLGANVTRSLKMVDPPLRIIGTDCNRYHLPLALTDRCILIPPAKAGDDYFAALAAIIEKEAIEMILPTHPVEVRAIAANRARFGGLQLALPDVAVVDRAQNKWLTHCVLRDGGLPVPKTWIIDSLQDIIGVFAEHEGRPIWVRGSGVPGRGVGVASLPCKDLDHAIGWISHYDGWGKFIASEYLPGDNLTWTGVFAHGKLVASQGRQRLEYVLPHVSPSGITGAPAVSKTISRKDLLEIGKRAGREALSKLRPSAARRVFRRLQGR